MEGKKADGWGGHGLQYFLPISSSSHGPIVRLPLDKWAAGPYNWPVVSKGAAAYAAAPCCFFAFVLRRGYLVHP